MDSSQYTEIPYSELSSDEKALRGLRDDSIRGIVRDLQKSKQWPERLAAAEAEMKRRDLF